MGLAARTVGRKASVGPGGVEKEVCFQPDYFRQGTTKSRICFANSKNKVFILAGDPGKTLVDAIVRQIHQRASEWRALPRLPHEADQIGTDLLAATQADGEAADNLRKTDSLTMRRAGFAIKLRDFEAYERDLDPEAWRDHRRAFFRAFVQHVLVLPHFFQLAIYLPRVIRLAAACEDFGDLRKIVDQLQQLCSNVEIHCAVSIKGRAGTVSGTEASEWILRWKEQLFATVRESIMAAFPPRLSKAGKRAWQDHMAAYRPRIDGV